MKNRFLLFLVFFIAVHNLKAEIFLPDTLVIAFWNVENLFDTLDDKQKNDDDFLPDGKQKWDTQRYETKLKSLAEVIRLMNKGTGPDILGVAEIENYLVLNDLSAKFLKDINYGIVHIEGPDERSIDVALFYKKDKFDFISKRGHRVDLPSRSPTRLILQVELIYRKKEPVTIFVNHWPSRRGGSEKSEANRLSAARVLRGTIDSLLALRNDEKIIIMGDFNDEPQNASISEIVGAVDYDCASVAYVPKSLINLAYRLKFDGIGSYKYRDQWNMLDQIMISPSLLKGNLSYLCNSFQVFKPQIMVTQSGRYEGAPNPTYGGERYLGGFSDHFPVLAKFVYVSK